MPDMKPIPRKDIAPFESLLKELQAKYVVYPQHPKQAEFKSLCMAKHGFRTKSVLEILLDDQPMHTPFKWTLAAGLCGWVIDPTDNGVAVDMMYLEVERILIECSVYAADDPLLSYEVSEIVGRYIFPGAGFLEQVHAPVGGPNPQETATSGVDLEIELESRIKDVNSTIYCLLVLHWMGELYDPDKHLRPSWNLIRKLAADKHILKSNGISGVDFFPHYASTRLRECWSRYMPSFSMLYAAHYIRVTRNRTLLEAIITAQIDARKVIELLPEWLGKSAYYYSKYLKLIENTGHSPIGEWLAGSQVNKSFRPRKVSSSLDSDIRKILQKTSKSKGSRRNISSKNGL